MSIHSCAKIILPKEKKTYFFLRKLYHAAPNSSGNFNDQPILIQFHIKHIIFKHSTKFNFYILICFCIPKSKIEYASMVPYFLCGK